MDKRVNTWTPFILTDAVQPHVFLILVSAAVTCPYPVQNEAHVVSDTIPSLLQPEKK